MKIVMMTIKRMRYHNAPSLHTHTCTDTQRHDYMYMYILLNRFLDRTVNKHILTNSVGKPRCPYMYIGKHLMDFCVGIYLNCCRI